MFMLSEEKETFPEKTDCESFVSQTCRRATIQFMKESE